jgi:peptidoglycan/LPS O-acetylase OafA/YrhL
VSKIGYLEGLRGLAALVVVNEHLLKLFFFMAFSDAAMRSSGFGILEELSFPPFNMLHNGAWAVCVFFVLSGYVLSHSFFSEENTNHKNLGGKIVSRYFRLAIPVTASLILVWVLMVLGLFHFSDVATLTQTKEVDQYLVQPTLVDLLKQGFGNTLFSDEYAYNPPLWTMSVEMIGSIGIFVIQGIFLTFRHHKNAWLIRMGVYIALIALLFPTFYTGFLLGMLLCDCRNYSKSNQVLEAYAKYWVPVSLIIGVALCSYMIRGLYSNPFKIITFNEFHPYYEYLYNTWGAFFLIAGISYSRRATELLSTPILLALGKISFPLYLIHYTVMTSLTAYLYLNLAVEGHYTKAILSIGLSIPVMFAVAYGFEKVVNEPTIKFSRAIKNIISRYSNKKDKLQINHDLKRT